MAELPLLNDDLDIIQKLDDEPNDVGGLTAAELKAKFDEAGNAIKKFLNGTLIPAVVTDSATAADRAQQFEEMQTANARAVMLIENMTTGVQYLQPGEKPDAWLSRVDIDENNSRYSLWLALPLAPRKGLEYWTAEDQQAIVNDVLAALPEWTGGSY